MARVSTAARESLRVTFRSSLRRGARSGAVRKRPAIGDAQQIDAARAVELPRARRGAPRRRSVREPLREARPRRAARRTAKSSASTSRNWSGWGSVSRESWARSCGVRGCGDRWGRRRESWRSCSLPERTSSRLAAKVAAMAERSTTPPPQTGGRKLIRLRHSGMRPSIARQALQRVVHRVELGRRDVEDRAFLALAAVAIGA